MIAIRERREGKMPENRKRSLSAWMRQTWPVLMVGLGLVASIVWIAALAWLLVKVIELIA
jgi:cytoskeletal protein RodZ